MKRDNAGQTGRSKLPSKRAGSKPGSHAEVSFPVVREMLGRRRQQVSLRRLEEETGIGRQTLDDIVKGRTQQSNETTLRPLRGWCVRMLREGYDVGTAGEAAQGTKLIAIAYLVQDYPTEQQKELALEFYQKLREGYARTGAIPKWMQALKKLIDTEWP